MWIVGGVLLGLVLLTGLLGFHAGAHGHVAAASLGVLAALWLVVMALDGRSSSLLWSLFSADLVLSGGLGLVAWNGLSHRGVAALSRPAGIVGTEGIAVTDLSPEGIVRVRGENWSAAVMNGPVPKGAKVQVLEVSGIHLQVWGEPVVDAPPAALAFEVDQGPLAETSNEQSPREGTSWS